MPPKPLFLAAATLCCMAIALKKPTLSVAVAKDQHHRLKICKDNGLTVCSDSKAQPMSDSLIELIQTEQVAVLKSALAQCKCINGLDIGMDIITDLYCEKFGVEQ